MVSFRNVAAMLRLCMLAMWHSLTSFTVYYPGFHDISTRHLSVLLKMAAAEQVLGGADEGDFLELLIANERISEWMDELQTPGNPSRKKEIIMELDALVGSKNTYAEEATRVGLMPILTRVLSATRDEDTMDAISRIMVACSGPMASGGKVSEYTYGNVHVQIREGALGDGLGARVWTVAHILSKELASHAGFVAGHEVLEIGAGCGVCGIVAAKLGASKVVLTDVEGPVLCNLAQCVLLNSSQPLTHAPPTVQSSEGEETAQLAAPQQPSIAVEGQESSAEQEGMTGQGHGSSRAWDIDNMSVRQLDWLESLRLTNAQGTPQKRSATGGASCATIGTDDAKEFYANDLLRAAEDTVPAEQRPPSVPLDKQYSRIIGTDIMYEPMHAQLVAAVLAHRLASGGAALLCCAVRQARTFTTFTAECARLGLRYRKRQVQPAVEYGGILGRDQDYEGGFLLMAVDRVSHPCLEWHRDDWDV